jgi:hypothetical protein
MALMAKTTAGAFADYRGQGIMVCSALCMMPKGDNVADWIAKSDNVDWRLELECDLRGSVMLVGDNAVISVSEIESSSNEYGTAVKQMELRANLIALILQIVFDSRFKRIVKKGHIYIF